MWITDAWYVAGWASELDDGKILARTFLGEPVVVYRGESGKIVAFEDRCCHRLAPLSLGRVEGDDLRCMYHGLKFDAAGQCNEAPGQTRIPPTLRVRSYPIVQKDKLLWIWMGDPAQARESDIVPWPYLDSPEWTYAEGYIPYQANYMLIVDNLLDFSHLSFLHAGTIGSASIAETRPVVEKTPYGVRISRLMDNDEPSQLAKAVGHFKGKVDRWNIYDWRLRGNLLLMDAGFMEVGTGGHKGDRKHGIEFRHISTLTPETETTTHYFFAQARNFALQEPGLTEKIHKGVIAAFEEDRGMIEAQQRVINLKPDAPMQTIANDVSVLQVRRMIESLIEPRQAAE